MLVMDEPITNEELLGDYFTPEEVAEKMSLKPDTVTKLIRQKKLPAYRVGRSWRINKAEFARFMRTQRNINPLAQES